MNRFTLHVLGALALATGIRAQQPDAKPPTEQQQKPPTQEQPKPADEKPTSEEQRVDRRAQSMRDKIASGKQVITHVRVSLRLRNGNKMEGVVKDGRFVERVDGLRFVDASAKERGAGIRLWYSGGRRNYVFLPFADVAQYEVMQRLTQKQLDEIEVELRMKEQRQVADARKDAAKQAEGAPSAPAGETGTPVLGTPAMEQPVGQPTGSPKGQPAVEQAKTKDAKTGAKEGEGDGKDDANVELQRTYFQLLQDYPPAGGWNKERRDEISRRKAVIGANPSDKEKAFVEKFDLWLKACKHFGVDGSATKDNNEEGEDAGSTGTGESKSKGRRSKR